MRASVLFGALPLVAACAGPSPVPAGPPSPEAEKAPPLASSSAIVASAPAASSAPSVSPPPSTADAPRPGACVPPASPKKGGVVPDDVMAALTDAERSERPGIDGAERCVTTLGKNDDPETARNAGCSWGDEPLLLAFDGAHDRVAALMLHELPTAGEIGCPALEAWVVDDATQKRISTKRFAASATCKGRDLAVSAFADDLRRHGFDVPAKNLVDRQAVMPIGATEYRPVASLGAPLCGFFVRVSAAATSLDVDLISPDNASSAPLGKLALERAPCTKAPNGRCLTPERVFANATVREVALTPDRKRLAVLVATTPGGHDEPLRFQLATFALPAAALAALGPAGEEPHPIVGGDRDAHGCIGSAGYRWCEREKACVRPWELAKAKGIANDAAAIAAYCRLEPVGAVCFSDGGRGDGAIRA